MTGVARLDPGKWLDSVTESYPDQNFTLLPRPQIHLLMNEYDGLP
jgi:hypothetical protein